MKKYTVEVTPITAVHIGTGNEFSPLDYVIKEDKNNKYVYMRFNPERVVSELTEEEKTELMKYIEQDDFFEINKMFNEKVTEKNANYISDITHEIFDKYKTKLKNTENQLLIAEMYRNSSNQKPVIPGSSLKGAIRTAIVNEFAKNKDVINDKKKAEKEIMGYYDAKTDPFRNLHITDCEINGEKVQKIADFINFKEKRKNGEDFSKMQMIKEHIIGKMLNGDSKGECEITINEEMFSISKEIDKWKPFKKKISLNLIINACNSFYFNNLENEYNNFYKHSSHNTLRDNGKKTIEYIKRIINKDKNECLIRVGQFSQIENVTIEKHKKPWNKKGYGKTRTLTESKFPVGWVKLKFMSLEEVKEIRKKEDTARKEKELKLKEEQEKIEREKREKEEKERIEKERLEALTPEERLKEEIKKEIKSGDSRRISVIVKKCILETKEKEIFVFLRDQLQKIDEWKPKGGNNKKKKMKKRNEEINNILGD